MKRTIAMVVAFCALVAAGVGGLAMAMAWEHNPQGATYELAVDGTRVVHWGTWALIGLAWFLLVFVPLSLVGAGSIALSYHLDKRRRGAKRSRLCSKLDMTR